MKGLMELLGKKGKSLDEKSIKAKMEVLKDLKAQAMDAMGDKLNGAKKVEVSSNSEEGLKSGLEKAKELLEGKEDESDESEEELEESPAEEEAESEMSEDEIDAEIKELLAKKAALKNK